MVVRSGIVHAEARVLHCPTRPPVDDRGSCGTAFALRLSMHNTILHHHCQRCPRYLAKTKWSCLQWSGPGDPESSEPATRRVWSLKAHTLDFKKTHPCFGFQEDRGRGILRPGSGESGQGFTSMSSSVSFAPQKLQDLPSHNWMMYTTYKIQPAI